MTGKNKTKSALSGGMKISAAPLVTVLLFAGLWLFGETGIYNDSNQYIAMHIHREPAYSFFLWMFRSLIGENGYLEAVEKAGDTGQEFGTAGNSPGRGVSVGKYPQGLLAHGG